MRHTALKNGDSPPFYASALIFGTSILLQQTRLRLKSPRLEAVAIRKLYYWRVRVHGRTSSRSLALLRTRVIHARHAAPPYYSQHSTTHPHTHVDIHIIMKAGDCMLYVTLFMWGDQCQNYQPVYFSSGLLWYFGILLYLGILFIWVTLPICMGNFSSGWLPFGWLFIRFIWVTFIRVTWIWGYFGEGGGAPTAFLVLMRWVLKKTCRLMVYDVPAVRSDPSLGRILAENPADVHLWPPIAGLVDGHEYH